MSSDQPRRRESSGSPGSPMGSTAAIIIAIVAVVAGFLILRSIGDDDDDGGSLSDSTTTVESTVASSVTSPTTPASTTPPSTEFVPTVDGATAVVANASTVDGAAGRLTTALLGKEFTMGQATNASLKLEASVVYYDPTDPEAQAVATSIAFYMGGIEVGTMPAPPPVDPASPPTPPPPLAPPPPPVPPAMPGRYGARKPSAAEATRAAIVD